MFVLFQVSSGSLSWRNAGFGKGLFCIYWDKLVISVFESIYVMCYIHCLVNDKASLHLWNQAYFIMESEFLIFSIVHLQIFYWKILICIHWGDWSVIFLSCAYLAHWINLVVFLLFKWNIFILLYLCTWAFYLHVSLCTTYMLDAHRSQNNVSDLLELLM